MIPLLRTIFFKRAAITTLGLSFSSFQFKKLKLVCFPRYQCDELRSLTVATQQSSSLRAIVDLLRRHLLLVLTASSAAALAAITSILSPIYVSKVIEAITNGLIFSNDFNFGLAGLLGTSVSNAVLTWLYIKLVGELGEVIASELRVEILNQLLHQSVYFFDTHSVAELLSRLNVDIQEFKHSLKAIITTGVKTSVQMTSTIGQMIILSPKLTLTLSSGLPLIFLIGNIYGRFLRLLSGEARQIEAEVGNIAIEALSSIRTVKAFSAEDYQVEKYGERAALQSQKNISLLSHIGIFQGLTNFSSSACAAAVLFFGSLEVAQGSLGSAQLIAFLMTLQMAQKAVTDLVTMNVKFQNMLGAYDRIGIERKVGDFDELPRPLITISGLVEFKDVSFKYLNREGGVLNCVSLDASPGELIAIIGESGSGKSTIAALLESFYQPETGSISFDSVASEFIDKKNLRMQIGYVAQEPVLFSGSVRENICLGRSVEASELVQACKAAHIHDTIEALPEGYDTEITKTTLSGGQKQRIALARALLGKPKILILDEATSALDQFTESAVMQTIKDFRGSCTVILITHKMEHLKIADKIYKLSKGKISKQ
jgi:ATP-binding cassette subfamily B (MDR/TAP) protein 8